MLLAEASSSRGRTQAEDDGDDDEIIMEDIIKISKSGTCYFSIAPCAVPLLS